MERSSVSKRLEGHPLSRPNGPIVVSPLLRMLICLVLAILVRRKLGFKSNSIYTPHWKMGNLANQRGLGGCEPKHTEFEQRLDDSDI